MPPIFLFLSFIFGAVIGSFLNVCIYRLPRKLSIVSPPSSCTNCGNRLLAFENIPLLSYLFLRGRCRRCGEKISFRYPLIELIAATASTTLFIHHGPSLSYVVYFAFTSALIVITFIDLDYRIIPDAISIPGIFTGFISSFVLPDITWFQSLSGILTGGGILFVVAAGYEALTGREGMGGGDIKLLAMIGAFLGWKGALFTIMVSSLIGSLIGGALIILGGKDRKFQIPFGPFLSTGSVIFLFWGDRLIGWYMNLLSYGP